MTSISDLQKRIGQSFDRQGLMSTIGASLAKVDRGAVEIHLKPRQAISQQHGFVHAGAVAAIADTAAGYSALSLMEDGTGVLTTEYKINLLAPAAGDLLIARGRVVKAGRTLTMAIAEVVAKTGEDERLVAFLTATLMSIRNREGVVD